MSASKDTEIERLSRLPDPRPPEGGEAPGVLLSDRIEYYCRNYELVSPFEPDLLRPAGYDLRVGRNYSICGERKLLDDDGEFEIKPYQVAIIETLETINMPRFLIGRWNVRVKKAYQGLLWVGGAQVDPGFRGHLCCPIYNLSTQPVTLRRGDKLAMIDFVTTTPFKETCKTFPWKDRSMLVFGEYPLLNSGVEKQIEGFEEKIKEQKMSLDGFQSRMDTFVTITFAVIAVLFAGIGIIATKGPEQLSYFDPSIWIAGVALFFALRSFFEHRPLKWAKTAIAFLIAILVIATVLCFVSTGAKLNRLERQVQTLQRQTGKE